MEEEQGLVEEGPLSGFQFDGISTYLAMCGPFLRATNTPYVTFFINVRLVALASLLLPNSVGTFVQPAQSD